MPAPALQRKEESSFLTKRSKRLLFPGARGKPRSWAQPKKQKSFGSFLQKRTPSL
jgi:hypothetical protein